jgi:NADP-dependent 3-hydroxy acid dehydrogenase YdfG
MATLDGERIVVTGASRGLGRSMAERFSAEGARVTLTARDEDRLHDLAEELPGESLVVPGDVRASDDVERVVDETVAAFGGVDTLVNNAGVALLIQQDESFTTLVLGGTSVQALSLRVVSSIEGFTGAFLISLFLFTLTKSIDR